MDITEDRPTLRRMSERTNWCSAAVAQGLLGQRLGIERLVYRCGVGSRRRCYLLNI